MLTSHHHLLIPQDHLPLESISDRSWENDSRLTVLVLHAPNENDDKACKCLVRFANNSASQPPTIIQTHMAIQTKRPYHVDAVHTKQPHLEKCSFYVVCDACLRQRQSVAHLAVGCRSAVQ